MQTKTVALLATIAATALLFLASHYEKKDIPCAVCESPGHDPREHPGYSEPIWAAREVRAACVLSNAAGNRHRVSLYTDNTDFAASLYTDYLDAFSPDRRYRVEVYDAGPAPAPYKQEAAE